jgi:hypothetical protein
VDEITKLLIKRTNFSLDGACKDARRPAAVDGQPATARMFDREATSGGKQIPAGR